MKPDMNNIDEVVNGHLPSASEEQMDAVGIRVLRELRSQSVHALPELNERIVDAVSPPVFPWRVALASVLAAALLAILIGTVLWQRGSAAVVESADGGLFLDSGGQTIQAGERIAAGKVVRASGSGAMLKLADGSRIEMRAESRLSLEHADDGIRVRLSDGDVIVNAAKQHGHLYVQTKDVTVSVVGTVFLVKAEVQGSRVAVIEGEVHVQQGTTEKKLRPGEQLATSPSMIEAPVQEEISWSRHVEAHVAMLVQAQTSQAASSLVAIEEPRLSFEVTSIRPRGDAPLPTGGRGSNGRAGPAGPEGCGSPGAPELDGARFAIGNIALQHLIIMAYPEFFSSRGNCDGIARAHLLSGGPGWVRSDQWIIAANLPQGTPAYQPQDFMAGKALEIHRMLQSLLADRFKLVMRRETREMPVYLLKVGKDGPKFNGHPPGVVVTEGLSAEEARGRIVPGAPSFNVAPGGGAFGIGRRGENGSTTVGLNGISMSMKQLAHDLTGINGMPVLDRTELSGNYDFHIQYSDDGVAVPKIEQAIEGIGLKLEESKAPMEVWVIVSAEKPSEN